MHATDIVAYTYAAGLLCPGCTLNLVQAHNPFFAASRDDCPPELWLDEAAGYLEVDRHNESSFDSDEFPKVVFADEIQWEHCDECADFEYGDGAVCDGCGEVFGQ